MINKKAGYKGEELAEKYLKAKNFTILEKNYFIRGGEIDLITRDKDGTIVFVEVKLRTSQLFGLAEEAVTPHKIRKIKNAAQFYLTQHQLHDCPYRIDVVAIDLKSNPMISHQVSVTSY